MWLFEAFTQYRTQLVAVVYTHRNACDIFWKAFGFAIMHINSESTFEREEDFVVVLAAYETAVQCYLKWHSINWCINWIPASIETTSKQLEESHVILSTIQCWHRTIIVQFNSAGAHQTAKLSIKWTRGKTSECMQSPWSYQMEKYNWNC